MKAVVTFERIDVQPDRLKLRNSKKEVGEREFLESDEKEAEVVHFKRFVIGGKLEYAGGGRPEKFKLIIDARSDSVFIDAKETQAGPWRILILLNKAIRKLYHYVHRDEDPLKPTREDSDSKDQSLWVTSSGVRLAAVIHDVMCFGPLEGEIKLGEPVFIPRQSRSP